MYKDSRSKETRSFAPISKEDKNTVRVPISLLVGIVDFLFDPFQEEQSDVYQRTKALIDAAGGPIAEVWTKLHEIEDPVERARYFTEHLKDVQNGNGL